MLSLNILLISYLLVVLLFLVFTFFNLYHMWRFGIGETTNFFMIFLYIASLLVLAFFSVLYILKIDWSLPLF
ncbi:MAG: hypothetical protein ABIF17_03365 [Patescibacteria group bacterium]